MSNSDPSADFNGERTQWINQIHTGECREVMDDLPESSIHCCITSPPYYGLRDYGDDDQIGLEETFDEYVQTIVDVGRSIRRVLRPDGSWWLNLGDSFSSNPTGSQPSGEWSRPSREESKTGRTKRGSTQFPKKCKMLIPHRVAIALIDDGWIIRNDAIWHKKGGGMPESVKDRLSTTFESVFHLVPRQRYWYDLDAIREPYAEGTVEKSNWTSSNTREKTKVDDIVLNQGVGGIHDPNSSAEDVLNSSGKNPGDVFHESVAMFPDAHFAVMPESLVEPLIKATCPPKVCSECGTAYDRETESETTFHIGSGKSGRTPEGKHAGRSHAESGDYDLRMGPRTHTKTIGWSQQCECDTDETEPGITLDPFVGAGTVSKVAKDHGRRFVGIDLNPEYVSMAQARCGLDVDDPSVLSDDGQDHLGSFAAVTDGGSE